MDLQRFLVEGFRCENENEDEYVQVLFARSLVLCFGPGLRAHGMYYLRLRTTSFGFFPLTLLRAFKEKIKLMTAIVLHMGDAHDKKDVNEF